MRRASNRGDSFDSPTNSQGPAAASFAITSHQNSALISHPSWSRTWEARTSAFCQQDKWALH
jgi:hypothetical protein